MAVPRENVGRRFHDRPPTHVAFIAILVLVTGTTDVHLFESTSAEAAEPLAHSWEWVDQRHWQITSPIHEEPEVADEADGTRGSCVERMVDVHGRMMRDGTGYFDGVEALQKSACVEWTNRTFPERCARVDETRWQGLATTIPRQDMHFCIDRFEYPNRRGAYPWIMVSWNESRRICASEGKRLCTEAEWTFACEGEKALPYPYGYQRDSEACVIDKPWRAYNADALYSHDTSRAGAELALLSQRDCQVRHRRA